MYASLGAIAAFALIIGGWLYAHRDAPKFTTFLFLVAGFGLGGLVGALLNRVLMPALGAAGNTTARWIGFSAATIVAALCVVATLEVVVKGMWRSRANPKRWHPWLALALPTIALASGIPVLASIFGGIAGGLGEAGAALTQLTNAG